MGLQQKISDVLDWFEEASLPTVVLIAYLLLVFITWIDFKAGYQLSTALFYLIPIALISWKAGLRPGLWMVAISTLAWFFADLWSGHAYTHPAIPFWNAAMRGGFFLCVAYLLARLHTALRIERKLSLVDALSGLPNSRAFCDFVEEERLRSVRNQRQCSLAYIDIDNFKTVNDQLGHHEGDRLIRLVAASFQRSLRAVDKVGRLGGDEFGILLPETELAGAVHVLEKLRKQVNLQLEEEGWPVSVSIGLICFTQIPLSVTEMMRQADALMYRAKREGKNRVVAEQH